MPPVLDPINSKVDGLAFLGLSLAQNHYYGRGEGKDGKECDNNDNDAVSEKIGNPKSYTHQTAFDLNKVIDREYDCLQSTDDSGWLVGGGEAGPPTSYKLAALDSAHVEIMRIGTYRKDWGGLDREELLKVMTSGSILIPQIKVHPTDVVANDMLPPELEIRFDMEEASHGSCRQLVNLKNGDFEAFCRGPLPTNWQLRFLHNQFFRTFEFPSRFCPGAFHSTITRKAEFRSEAHRIAYFRKCSSAVSKWRSRGPKPLNTIPRHFDARPMTPEEARVYKARKIEEEESKSMENFYKVLTKQYSTDTDFVEPTEKENEAVADLVDKLEYLAPLPPAATTAKAIVNLEVVLDETWTGDDEYEQYDECSLGETSSTCETQPSDEEGNTTTKQSTTEQQHGKVFEKYQITTKSGIKRDECNAESETTNTDTDDSSIMQTTAELTNEQQQVIIGENLTTTTPNTIEIAEAVSSKIIEAISDAATDDAQVAGSFANSSSNMNSLPTRETAPEDCHSGVWLFTDRENITHFFAPNFLPPYDTPEKRKIIFDVLREEWNEESLSWKPYGYQGSRAIANHQDEENVLEVMSNVVSTVMDGVCSPTVSHSKRLFATGN